VTVADLNHEMRRRITSQVIFDVIAREGLEAATVRRIAAEVGFSTAVITHYFADKDDMILSAYEVMAEEIMVTFNKHYSASPPDLLGYLLSLSAVNPTARARWQAYIAIWDRSLRNDRLRAILKARLNTFLEHIECFIDAINPDCPNRKVAASRLFSLSQGMATHILLDDSAWQEDDIRAVFAEEIEAIVKQKVPTPQQA
jgi:AcrR family transcriptional regulator